MGKKIMKALKRILKIGLKLLPVLILPALIVVIAATVSDTTVSVLSFFFSDETEKYLGKSYFDKGSVKSVYEAAYLSSIFESGSGQFPDHTANMTGAYAGKVISGEERTDGKWRYGISQMSPLDALGFTGILATKYRNDPETCAYYAAFEAYTGSSDTSVFKSQYFVDEWTNAFRSVPEQFTYDQLVYMKGKYADPAETIFADKTGMTNISAPEHSVLRMAIFSVSVAYKNSGAVSSAADAIKKAGKLTDEQMLDILYDEAAARSNRTDAIDAYSLNVSTDRWERERAAAKRIVTENIDIFSADYELSWYTTLKDINIYYSVSDTLPYVKQILQKDYPDTVFYGESGYKKVASSGCSICSFTMLASYLMRQYITVEEVAAFSSARRINTQDMGSNGVWGKMAEHFGFSYIGAEYTSGTSAAGILRDNLGKGYVCGVSVHEGYWTKGSHQMAVLAYRFNNELMRDEVYVATSSYGMPKDGGNNNGWYPMEMLTRDLKAIRIFRR